MYLIGSPAFAGLFYGADLLSGAKVIVGVFEGVKIYAAMIWCVQWRPRLLAIHEVEHE